MCVDDLKKLNGGILLLKDENEKNLYFWCGITGSLIMLVLFLLIYIFFLRRNTKKYAAIERNIL